MCSTPGMFSSSATGHPVVWLSGKSSSSAFRRSWFDSQKGSLSTHYVHIVACIPISITARVFFPIPDIVPLLCVCARAEGAGDTI